jgi:hypothetical protein
MFKCATLVLGTVLLATTGTVASAKDGGRIDRVQARQQQDLEHKRHTGQLTRREHAALLAEQAHIAELERRARADGYISPRERQVIRNAQRAADSHIAHLSANRRVNYWRHWKHIYGYGSRHGS